MKKLIAAVALSAVAVLPSVSAAEEGGFFDIADAKDWTYTVGYNVLTSHTSSDGYTDSKTDEFVPWNETNEITMVRVNLNDNFGVGIGKGVNSYYEDTVLAGVEIHTDVNSGGKFDFGADIGLASGYEELFDATGGVIPFVNPFFRANYEIIENHLTVSGKVGTVNFMAINGWVELTFAF